MKIGTYYYPEQWPREQWERDFDNIAAMGMQIIHLAEFAWHTMEPREGEIHLDWLDECLTMAKQRKMEVILCTPTAAPPMWLVKKYPDIVPVDENGKRYRLGGRRHYSPTSPEMATAARRIVSALADRFGNHPSVIGWQIDNEYGSQFFDQNAHAHQAFRDWLKRKYGSIAQLNRAWGCQFWNQYYDDFTQINLPGTRTVTYDNPHSVLDASRFWSWAYGNFNKLQADILRPKIGKRFLTTNFMPGDSTLDANPADMMDDLTMTSWDAYPVSGWDKDPKDQTFRIAGPVFMGFQNDLMASYNGRWAQMELQPGQINWSGYPVLPYPGAVRLWIWTAFAHGAEFVTTYRFRQPRFAIEMFHGGLVGHDGVTPSPGGREFEQCVMEMQRLDLAKVPAVAEELEVKNTVGLVYDLDQIYWYRILPQAKRWDPWRWWYGCYEAITRLGLNVKILHPGKPWPKGLPVVIAPGIQMVSDAFVQEWKDYVTAGGNLLLTCRTGLMDKTGQFFEGPTGMPILPLIGASIEAYDSLPEGINGHVEIDGRSYDWGAWGDQLKPNEGTQVLGKYTDQFYAGAVALTRKKHARGSVTYCGFLPEQPGINALIELVARDAGMAINPALDRARVYRRGPYHVLLNYRDVPVTAPAADKANFLIGARIVKPAGVAVWTE